MKEKIGWFTFGLFVLGTFWQGLVGGIIVSGCWAIALIVLWPFLIAWGHKQELKVYAVRRENFYEVSLYPGDRSVHNRAERHRKLLEESGNQLGVIVHEIYYRDAGHEEENWEAFVLRRNKFILDDTKKRHIKINNQDREWYKLHILNQEGIQI